MFRALFAFERKFSCALDRGRSFRIGFTFGLPHGGHESDIPMNRTTFLLSLHHRSAILWPRHRKLSLRQLYTSPNCSMASPATLAAQAAMTTIDLSNYDPEQSKLMDERCILVDEEDNAIGAMDKKTCTLGKISELDCLLN